MFKKKEKPSTKENVPSVLLFKPIQPNSLGKIIVYPFGIFRNSLIAI